MRILITGASGWIGFSMAQKLAGLYGAESLQLLFLAEPQHSREAERAAALEQAGFHILRHDLLSSPFPAEQIEPFDVLIHLAAYTHTEKESTAGRVNDEGTRILLEALGENLRGKKIIYTGSITSVDCFDPLPAGVCETTPCKPLTSYGAAKLRGEQILQQLSKPLGFEWIILRLPTVYGPGCRPDGLFDLINRNHLVTYIQWPGSLSLLYIDDLNDWVVRLMENGLAGNKLLHVADPDPVAYTQLFPEPPRLALPSFLWRMIRGSVLFCIRRLRMPHGLFISGWRLCHLLGNSMVFDTTQAQQAAPAQYTALDQGLQKTWQVGQ